MRLEALWSLEISTSSGWMAAGVVIFQPRRVFGDFFEAGRILGGDRSYYYCGDYVVENLALRAKVHAVRYAGDATDVFGSGDRFIFEISAGLENAVGRDVIELPARLLERHDEIITLRLTKREDA